jgi:heptosyltransferase-1
LKILILKPSSLGDVIQALPVLRLLKAHQPADQIYWWLSDDLAELLEGDPDLSGLILFQRRRWALPLNWQELFQSLRQIRAERFDWVIDLQGLARSGLVSWLAHSGLSIGVEDWREGAPAFYDVVVPRPSPLTHAVDWYLEVLKALRIPVHWNFNWLPERPQLRASFEKKWSLGNACWIVLIPGARWTNKQWPVESYRQLASKLSSQRDDLRFVILGSAGDADLGQSIASGAPHRCLDLTGQTSLSEMIQWLRLSSVVVTNDTGPMHIAAALDKPVVALFGPTEPRRTGPYRQLDRVLRVPLPCAPCLKRICHFERPLECLRGISPQAVLEKVTALLT